MFFDRLKYTAFNEDSELELKLLPEKVKSIFVVAGNGSRVLPLFFKEPKKVNIVDVSKTQLLLTELKIESLKQLNYSNFLFFWDYFDKEKNWKKRKKIFYDLKLRKEVFEYFENYFKKNNWESILYMGEWEMAFKKVSKINNKIIGEDKILELFSIKNRKEYDYFLKNIFPWNKFLFSLFLLGGKKNFDALVYKGQYPKNNTGKSYFIFYRNVFKRKFNQLMVGENFFMQFLFFGKILNKASLPFEAQKANFEKIKEGIKKAEINYILGDLVESVKKEKKVNFVSNSDILSYAKKDYAEEFLNKIYSSLSKNALVANRYYLHIPEVRSGKFKDVSLEYQKEIENEKTGMYKIEIFKKI